MTNSPPPPQPPPPPRGQVSLYGNLHDPNDPDPPAVISAAPVRYQHNEASANEPKKPVDPALLFQPQIRRPQAKQSKPKATFPKSLPKAAPNAAAAVTAAPAAPKTTLADWTAHEEDEYAYGTLERPQRGGRKKKKKNRREEETEINWDEPYDVGKPTNVELYLKSDEKTNEVLEWKALIYEHRERRASSELSSDDGEHRGRALQNQFAPPPAQAFAPPPPTPPYHPESDVEATTSREPTSPSKSPYHEPAPPPISSAAVISQAPVRYNVQSDTAMEDADQDQPFAEHDAGSSNDPVDAPRSKAPGQAGFAQRFMSKYGWTKGQGLGAEQSGIVNPLRVKVDKRRKKADADGGGWAEPGGRGKIIGGKRKDDGTSKFGPMSQVIVLRNMLENMTNLQEEISDGLGQEIGEECGEKYGRVERLYIDQETRQVFIRFTDQVSALRAVNELDGRVFNGNAISPSFYDVDRFEKGVYTPP